jgi:alkaline phosphatase
MKEETQMKSNKVLSYASILIAVAFSLGGAASALATEKPVAKHIILMVGDGMHIEHEIATSRYLYGTDFDLSFHRLPYKADVATWDVTTYNYWADPSRLNKPPYNPDSIEPEVGYDPAVGGKRPFPLGPELEGAKAYHLVKATDSASAATAWATGYKTDDGNIAWLPGDPEGGALKTIAELLREQKGFAIGVVSTVPFTHATPAAHVSHNKSRNNYEAIGTEILTAIKPEVVIGGGHPGTDGSPSYKYISQTDYDNFKSGAFGAEYVFVERQTGVDGGVSLLTAAQQAAEQGKKLFGLYGLENAGNFESPIPKDFPGTPAVKPATAENPNLAEASLAALKVLSQDPDGFFVMIEQGDIDWANHADDFQRMVGTTFDLHAAVQAVIDFVNQPEDGMNWGNTLLVVTADHSNSYMRNLEVLGAGDLPEQVPGGACPPGYPGTCPNYPGSEVSYGSTAHTNELVRFYALGAGVNKFRKYEGKWYRGTRILDNTQIFHMLMEASGSKTEPSLGLK